jgi:arginase family enzyme
MELSSYFAPLVKPELKSRESYYTSQIGAHIEAHIPGAFPSLDQVQLALFSVREDRGSLHNKGCDEGGGLIRNKLYDLSWNFNFPWVDLGEFISGSTLLDTYTGLTEVLEALRTANIFPIIIGGGQDLTYPQYKAFARLGEKVDLLVIDSHFDLDEDPEGIKTTSSISYLHKILSDEPNYLFNFSNLGYQSHFIGEEILHFMDRQNFDIYRLGEINGNIADAEPVIRSANIISFDIRSVRFSDAPGCQDQSPNGFYGEDACQLFRYAGMNDQLQSLGVFEYNPEYDNRDQTAGLIAQMLWYFLEGFSTRKQDNPLKSSIHFYKYRTSLKSNPSEIIFFKSKKTSRWWMQVPYPANYRKNNFFHLIPCRYEDFQKASNGEVPERWWRSHQKL